MFGNFLRDEPGAELAEYAVGVAFLVAIGGIVYPERFTLSHSVP